VSNLNAKNRLSKPFIKNSKLIFTLPLGGKIRRGIAVLRGTVTLSAGTTSGTLKGEGGPQNLISRIIVTATPTGGSRYPGGKIVDSDVRGLLKYAATQRNGKFLADLSASTLNSGAAATYTVYCPIPIYFADCVQRNQLATALNTDPGTYASVQVEIDTADIKACYSGNDRVEDYSGLTVDWIDERVAVPGDTSVLYQESHTMLIAASNKRALDEAMPQDGAFLSWQICAEATAQQNLADTLLNRVVTSGPTLDYDKYAMDIREAMFADEWLDPAQAATGFYFVDFTDGVAQANRVPAGTLQTYFDVNNVSGANLDNLNIFTRRTFDPIPAPAAK
jgi:hypothetical protein